MTTRLLAAVVFFVGSLGFAQGDLGELVAALTSNNPQVRAEAACDIGRSGFRAENAIPALVRLLGDAATVVELECHRGGWSGHGRRETSPGQQAVVALSNIGIASFDPLVDALEHVSPTVRKNAALGLGRLEDERAVTPLVGRLTDEMPVVREQVVWALGHIESSQAVAPLAAVLKIDNQERVREQAAWALGKIEDHRAVAPLIDALEDGGPRVREQSAWALGKLDAREAVSALTRVVSDPDPEVREQASWALGKWFDIIALEALKDDLAGLKKVAITSSTGCRLSRASYCPSLRFCWSSFRSTR